MEGKKGRKEERDKGKFTSLYPFPSLVPFGLALVMCTLVCSHDGMTESSDTVIYRLTAPSSADKRINELLEPIRKSHSLPGLAGAIVTGQCIAGIGAVGVRKQGADIPITIGDQFHIGSDTKAMTATVIGRLIEQGRLKWDTSMAQIFPELASTMSKELRKVTINHLLSHRSGLPANLPGGWWRIALDKPIQDQRMEAVRIASNATLLSTPGDKYEYSNLGYVVLGAIAEKVTDKSWEELMSQELFRPLGITQAGFGAMGTAGNIDQPLQHAFDGKPVEPGPRSDNPPVMGPAGRVHCTLADWGCFVADQLRGANGDRALLKPDTYRALHTPPFGGDYASGWVVTDRKWGGGRVLTHGGDNTMNHAVVWMAPLKDFAVLMVTNQGGPVAARACDEGASALIGLYSDW